MSHRSPYEVDHPPPYDSSPRPQPSQSTEDTPLLLGQSANKRRTARLGSAWLRIVLLPIGALLLATLLAQNVGLVPCPLNDVSAARKARLRGEWRLEEEWHHREAEAWARERTAHGVALKAWEEERKIHDEERDAWHKQWEEDRKARDAEEEGWRKRREEEQKAHEAKREEWRRQREAERKAHDEEKEEWRRQREAARKAHDEEKEEWRRQREEEELHRLEVLRRSQGVYWTEPHGDAHCHAYGTRTYIAYLRDIPGDLNWREVCDYMPPVVIHGRAFSKPDKCERNGGGEVVGVWYVDFDEPGCQPHWGWTQSKGCSPGQAGIERYEGRLDGLASGDDWQMMCHTTPATIGGTYFDHPSSCEYRGYWSGMVGIWDYPNASC